MKVIKRVSSIIFREDLILCKTKGGYSVIKKIDNIDYSTERKFKTLRKAKRYFEINEERLFDDMRYVADYEQKDIVSLKELLREGYVGITEKHIAVKELSGDDKSIETIINELEA